MGPDGDAGLRGQRPEPRLQPRDRRVPGRLGGETTTPARSSDEEDEIYTQRLAASGAQVGTDDRRISRMGPDGDNGLRRHRARAWWPAPGRTSTWWPGTARTTPARWSPTRTRSTPSASAPTGPRSATTTCASRRWASTATTAATPSQPAVAYGSQANEYLIAWHGDPDPPQANDEFEVFARRFGAGPPAAVCKALPPPPPPSPGDPDDITLTTGQLLINQRIDQAAIRRANGVEAWLGDGVEGRDLCQGALGANELGPGITTDLAGPPLALVAPDPRPIVVAAAKPADPSQIRLTTGQLLINQRISQAAIRRLNALKARLDTGLTGGDVDDATLAQPAFVAGLRVLAAPPPASAPAASATIVAPASAGDPSQITLTTTQLLINQRISQAAVRRANELMARIEDGLLAGDVRDGTLTALDLAPGVAP